MPRAHPTTVLVTTEHPEGRHAVRVLKAAGNTLVEAIGGGELSLTVTTDRKIRALNKSWRGKDKATDVLSFEQDPALGLLGDVVISLDTARRQAAERKLRLGDELVRLLVHGTCHLRGFDHETGLADAARMAKEETRLLRKLGYEVSGMVADALSVPGQLDARSSKARKTRKTPDFRSS